MSEFGFVGFMDYWINYKITISREKVFPLLAGEDKVYLVNFFLFQ